MHVPRIDKYTISRKEKIAVMRFLRLQLIVMISLFVAIDLLWSKTAATSTLLGGLLAVVPNIFLSVYLFTRTHFRKPTQIAKAFYVGEAIKISVMIILLVLMLRCYTVALAPLLIGLIGTYAVYIVSPVVLRSVL